GVAGVAVVAGVWGGVGRRVRSRRERWRRRADGPGHVRSGSGVWARWSRTVARFPAVLAAVAVAVMVVVSLPVLHLRLGASDFSNDPPSSHTYKAYEMLAEGFGPGFNGSLLVVAQTQSAADRAALDRLDPARTRLPRVAR